MHHHRVELAAVDVFPPFQPLRPLRRYLLSVLHEVVGAQVGGASVLEVYLQVGLPPMEAEGAIHQQLSPDERLAALSVLSVAQSERRAAVLALAVAVLRAGLLRTTGKQLFLYALDAEQVAVLRDVVGQVFVVG